MGLMQSYLYGADSINWNQLDPLVFSAKFEGNAQSPSRTDWDILSQKSTSKINKVWTNNQQKNKSNLIFINITLIYLHQKHYFDVEKDVFLHFNC